MVASVWTRKAQLQARENGRVRCLVCERRCLLVEGGMGWCRTRIHENGHLYTLIYGAVSSVSVNPIEKKPLYHFYPGSRALTVGSWGCNFGCPWCQNWELSKQVRPDRGRFLSPADFVAETIRLGCRGTSVSFNEPTLSHEWSCELFRLARDRGLYNTMVTNGYMTAEALEALAESGLDALNVDIKGDARSVWKYGKGIEVNKVWERCRHARTLGLHLEVTTLVIPGINDDDVCLRTMARRIASELGSGTPWHVSGYYPAYHFDAPPTPIATLEKAWAIGRNVGLHFVYPGNFPGHPYDNTYCPRCGSLLVERYGYDIVAFGLSNGCCPRCETAIPGVGWDWR